MKKYIIYIGILIVGLLLGWILFGNSPTNEKVHQHNEVTENNQIWTCSMHPQIMQPEPGDCPICGMDLIPAETGADGLAADQFKLTENAMSLANIQTTTVGQHLAEDNVVKLSGKIAVNEEENLVQVSYFSGRIEKLNVNFTGEEIRKGQLLATIYSPELYATQQELLTAVSLKESQPELYKAVRNKLKFWKLSDNQINQIETSGKAKENFPVYATVSGTVTEKLIEQGSAIKQGQPLLKISNLNTVWANFDLFENQIDLFKIGKEISISSNAYPNKEFKGKVNFIDPVLNTKTRTVTLRVVLKNKNNEFKPGMFVEGKIKAAISNTNKIIMVPASAVLWTGERSVVYVKTNPNEPVFEMREIVLGNQIGTNYQVLKGLESNVEIVSNGTFTIDAAAQLQGKKSMMNKTGGKIMTGHEGHLGMDNTSPNFKESTSKVNQRIKVSNVFQKQLNAVFSDYINLKNALVEDNSKEVVKHSKKLLNNLSKVDIKLLKESNAHNAWMSFEKEIKSSTIAISNTYDIKEQRNYFKHLSTNLINAIEVFGVNEKVYKQFCPMANSNKGGFWLSKEEQILNPYFGEAMLKCGEVKQVID
jgi:Cu(I)/Ag(I) efflux system membrane fusion protein